MVTCEQYDIDRYLVSIDGGGTYLVDLQEFENNGFCGCRDFQYRHLPLLQKEEDERGSGKEVPKVMRRCRHIIGMAEKVEWGNRLS